MSRSALASPQPSRVGPYLLAECIGRGGMAAVYRATRQGPAGFEKTLVVKCMLPQLATRTDLVELFFAEAKLSAQLSHPNIVQVHDFGVADGVPYLVMEHLDGRNLTQLAKVLREGNRKLPVGAAVNIARNVCSALAYAHEFVDRGGVRRQVIHRDVSPSNVMVCRDGSVKLLDFGIAKMIGQFETEATQVLRGKYAYMAPEQVSGKPIDRRVDVFAAGILLHEMLTGKRLFTAENDWGVLERIAAAIVPPPSAGNPEVPRSLDNVVMTALRRDPTERYGSGRRMGEALAQLESITFSRARLRDWLLDLLPPDPVTCQVCGKAASSGKECGECGTLAPRADEASAESSVALPPLPPPLPPPPAPPPRLQVVRTPPGVPIFRVEDLVAKPPFPPPPAPPRLMVVPVEPEVAPEDDGDTGESVPTFLFEFPTPVEPMRLPLPPPLEPAPVELADGSFALVDGSFAQVGAPFPPPLSAPLASPAAARRTAPVAQARVALGFGEPRARTLPDGGLPSRRPVSGVYSRSSRLDASLHDLRPRNRLGLLAASVLVAALVVVGGNLAIPVLSARSRVPAMTPPAPAPMTAVAKPAAAPTTARAAAPAGSTRTVPTLVAAAAPAPSAPAAIRPSPAPAHPVLGVPKPARPSSRSSHTSSRSAHSAPGHIAEPKSEPSVEPSERPAPEPTPHRTVKEGRLVDPFAGSE